MQAQGTVDGRFELVREVFEANVERGELGASCCVVLDGTTVVDLWGGWADAAGTRAWQADTLVNAYSVGKAFTGLQVLQLVADGRLELDATADGVWPELLAGQQGATVRHALSHQAGVPAIREHLANEDLSTWTTMADAVAQTEPWWVPGTAHAYHTNTYGHLVGEIARRVSGQTPGEWLREAVAEPLGADVHWGVRPADDGRCAEVQWDGGLGTGTALDWDEVAALPHDQAMVLTSYFNPPGYSSLGIVNTTAWRRAQVPSTNLHASARGVAKVYDALVADARRDGPTRLLDADLLAEATRPQSDGWCPVLERDVSFGLGFQPTRPDRPFGPNPGSFGHFGTGGALGMADPSAGLAFGYVMNRVRPRWQNERNRALVDAVYACL